MTWRRTATPPRPSSMASLRCGAKVFCGLSKTRWKHRKPSYKHQRKPHLQIPTLSVTSLRWSLGFGAFLVFGSWCLELSWRCLDLGVWCFDSPVVQREDGGNAEVIGLVSGCNT